MKTSLQRIKYSEEEIKKKKESMVKLKSEATELSKISEDESINEEFQNVDARLESNHVRCKEIKELVEKEIEDYNAHYLSMQETEKWLLQISFQLMAHNSLYITTREHTQQQLDQHLVLLEQIKEHQEVLDKSRTRGEAQAERYKESNPDLRATLPRNRHPSLARLRRCFRKKILMENV